ncbi:MAG: EamA family transporter [Synergistaceae bacterium]|nr:EamA family transporter [Synergistaceae bacterium]
MTINKDRLLGAGLVLAASMCWGTTGILQALAPEGAPPLTMGGIRIFVSGVILLIWRSLTPGGLKFIRLLNGRALLLSVAGIMGFQFSFFTALKLTGVSAGTMIAIGLSPVFAGALGAVAEKEPLSGRWGLSTAVAVIGCSLLVTGGHAGEASVHPVGAALALAAAFFYALMGLGLKRQARFVSSTEATTATTGAAILIGLPVLILQDSSWLFSLRGAAIGFSLGFVTMAFPMCLFTIGLGKIFLRDAYTISLAEPVTACVLSALLLGERLSLVSIMGAAMIMGGILLLPVAAEEAGE